MLQIALGHDLFVVTDVTKSLIGHATSIAIATNQGLFLKIMSFV